LKEAGSKQWQKVKQKWAKLTDDDVLLIRASAISSSGKFRSGTALRKTLLNTKATNSFERMKRRRVERAKKRRKRGALNTR